MCFGSLKSGLEMLNAILISLCYIHILLMVSISNLRSRCFSAKRRQLRMFIVLLRESDVLIVAEEEGAVHGVIVFSQVRFEVGH